MDKIEQIARMCHQTNKAWCELNGDLKRLGRSTTMAKRQRYQRRRI
jgi:hypothetical protein